MDSASEHSETQARLALMLLSAVLWSLFGFDVLVFAGSQLATAHESAVPAAASIWVPWWDMEHPVSGVYMAVVLAIGAVGLWFHLRMRKVDGEALPIGRMTYPLLGAIAVAVLVDRYAWNVIAELTASSGADETVLGERDEYAYTLTAAHMIGEVLWTVLAAPWVAVSVTAAAFASTHGQYYLPGLISVFVGGLLFGWLRIISGGLAAPVLAHVAMNAWVVYEDWAELQAV
jgi:hypothetical protein